MKYMQIKLKESADQAPVMHFIMVLMIIFMLKFKNSNNVIYLIIYEDVVNIN